MNTASRKPTQARLALTTEPYFLFHPSFEEPDAEQAYGGAPANGETPGNYMPDDATRDWTRRMHYAGWRASRARDGREAAWWRQRHYDCRDRIVLGNQKLTFRAVQKWGPSPQFADDMAGECQLVLIRAVTAFNPWLGIRFSTYAFTCLMRALSRMSQRQAADRLSQALPWGSLPSGEPYDDGFEEPAPRGSARLHECLQEGHSLLTPREKTVLKRRYHLDDDRPRTETLAQVGRELGLSKERVRQLQSTALGKLRAALLSEAGNS